MPYLLYKALSLFIMPLGIAFLALIAAITLLMAHRRKSSLVMLLFLVSWLWLWSTPWWSNCIRRNMESRYTWMPASQYQPADAIVSLGGGIRGSAGIAFPQFDLNYAADRELFAAQLYHAGKSKMVIVSGGWDPQTGSDIAGIAQKQFLVMLGVPPEAVRIEGYSRNTVDNANEIMRMMNPVKGKSILLVTSALHMPRACRLFSRTGLKVIPAPTDFEVLKPPFSLNLFLPDAGALETSTRAAHEIVGLWAARIGIQ